MAKGDGQGGVDVIEISSTQPKDKKVTEKKPYTGYGFKEVRICSNFQPFEKILTSLNP